MKQFRIALTIILTLCMSAFTHKATAQFSGGDGSENNPYIITTAEQLAQLATFVNTGNENYDYKYFKLGNDIDLSAYQSGTGWTPIGGTPSEYGTYAFSGYFDGNSKKITGLYINNPNLDYAGLFGYLYDATIKNLGVENVNIRGNDYVGSIAGKGSTSSATFDHIDNCYSTGKVSGNENVGGIAGDGYLYIFYSFSTCEVSGNNYVGGITGDFFGTINNCYSTGAVNGNNYVGGIAGRARSIYIITYIGSILKNSVALNPYVKGIGSYVGRITGIDGTYANISNNAAYDGILNSAGNTLWERIGASDLDGADMSLQAIKSDGTLGGRFTADDGWTTQNGKLPGLFGKPVDMPTHLGGGTGIVETSSLAFPHVYPNPVNYELKITNYEGGDTNKGINPLVEIYDVMGRRVATVNTHPCADTERSRSINVEFLPSGMYFLKIGNKTIKFVKQ